MQRNTFSKSEVIYKNSKNKLTHVIRQSKKKYFKDKFDNDKFVALNGTHCTDKREIVDHFNNYFTNIGHRLNVNLMQTGNDPTQFVFKCIKFFCTPTYPEEIINIVKKQIQRNQVVSTC